jgi:hypothetical protein
VEGESPREGGGRKKLGAMVLSPASLSRSRGPQCQTLTS